MKYDYDYKQALDALRLLREAAVTGCMRNLSNGVCCNLTYQFGFDHGYEFVLAHADDWPHAMRWEAGQGASDAMLGKLKDYFVPHTWGVAKWEGENLERRLDLIDHLIGKCEAALAS